LEAVADGVTTMLLGMQQVPMTTTTKMIEEIHQLDLSVHKMTEVEDVEEAEAEEEEDPQVPASNAMKKAIWPENVQMLTSAQAVVEAEVADQEEVLASSVEKKAISQGNALTKISREIETEETEVVAEAEVAVQEEVCASSVTKKVISPESALMNKKADPTRDKEEMMGALLEEMMTETGIGMITTMIMLVEVAIGELLMKMLGVLHLLTITGVETTKISLLTILEQVIKAMLMLVILHGDDLINYGSYGIFIKIDFTNYLF